MAATGPFQKPIIPAVVPDSAGSIRSTPARIAIRNNCPRAASSSSAQDRRGCRSPTNCGRSGRKVYLAVGPHDRPPRSYRGRDFCWWLGVLGKWDLSAPPLGAEHVTIAVSGAHGGHTVDFRDLADERYHTPRSGRRLRRRRHALRVRPAHQHRERRCELLVACSTRPTPTSPGTDWICPRSRKPASSARIRTV